MSELDEHNLLYKVTFEVHILGTNNYHIDILCQSFMLNKIEKRS